MKHRVSGIYTHENLIILVDGKPISIEPSRKFINHSQGFGAGHLGSGPAQSALAIMLSLTNKENSMVYHQDFKQEFLSNPEYLDNDFWFEVDLDSWIAEKDKTLMRF